MGPRGTKIIGLSSYTLVTPYWASPGEEAHETLGAPLY
jgi:hypothetical protein